MNLKKQFGFAKGVSIEACKIQAMEYIIENQNNNYIAVFLDLKSAYNRVDRVKLMQTLAELGILDDT